MRRRGVGWLIVSPTPFRGLRFEQIWQQQANSFIVLVFAPFLQPTSSLPPSQSCCFPTTALFPLPLLARAITHK